MKRLIRSSRLLVSLPLALCVASVAMADASEEQLKKIVQDSKIKPGLWEIQHKTAVNGQELPDMQQMMANVPPGMRGQVEAMMAKNGAGMTEKGVSVCITQEQINNNTYGMDNKGHCKVSDVQHSGNRTSLKMRCEDPKGEGETTVTQISPVQWQSTTRMTIEEQGKPQAINSEATGRWLKADCGAIKPH